MGVNVLVVAAHPDDEVLGCGATIAKRVRAGDSVFVAILGTGAAARDGSGADEIKALRGQCHAAGEKLGACVVEMCDFPDNCFDIVPLLNIVKQVEAWVEMYKPEAIYTHHVGCLNVDHSTTARAVITATRPMAGRPTREVLMFEVPSSTEWAFGRFGEFQPNVFERVSYDHLAAKAAAMKCYDGEMRQYPHPRSDAGLGIIAQRWGTVIGYEAAEAFEAVRIIR